jgi:hypothetical protein
MAAKVSFLVRVAFDATDLLSLPQVDSLNWKSQLTLEQKVLHIAIHVLCYIGRVFLIAQVHNRLETLEKYIRKQIEPRFTSKWSHRAGTPLPRYLLELKATNDADDDLEIDTNAQIGAVLFTTVAADPAKWTLQGVPLGCKAQFMLLLLVVRLTPPGKVGLSLSGPVLPRNSQPQPQQSQMDIDTSELRSKAGKVPKKPPSEVLRASFDKHVRAAHPKGSDVVGEVIRTETQRQEFKRFKKGMHLCNNLPSSTI